MATIGAPATASGRPDVREGVPAIRATGIVKHFGHLQALRGASIDLFPGEVTALVGDNGAGKSTFTKVICGALQADEGEIEFWGEPTKVQSTNHAHELGVHTVYQDLALAPHLSVSDNLFLGREEVRHGWRRFLGEVDRRLMVDETRDAMGRLGITLKDYNVPVGNLSGGQRRDHIVLETLLELCERRLSHDLADHEQILPYIRVPVDVGFVIGSLAVRNLVRGGIAAE